MKNKAMGYLLVCFFAMLAETTNAQEFFQIQKITPTPSLQGVNFRERRDAGVVKQNFEKTCAAAALATLINKIATKPIDEQVVLETMLSSASEARIKDIEHNGFSVGDISNASQILGYFPTAVYLQRPEEITKIKGPVIAHLQSGGEAHFVVITSINQGKVYLADPQFGNRRLGTQKFLDQFTGNVLAIESRE